MKLQTYAPSTHKISIHPSPYVTPGKWEREIAQKIYALTGKHAFREEIIRARQIFDCLPRSFRSNLDHDFSFNFLPLFLAGFKLHLPHKYVEDSNSVFDSALFIQNVWQNKKLSIQTYLCAHRGYGNETQKHSLVDRVPILQLKNALNLLSGLVTASSSNVGLISLKQQFATEKVSSNMFPSMFIEYAKKNTLEDLFNKIESHENQIRCSVGDFSLANNWKIEGLDPYTDLVLRFIEQRYGENWRSITRDGLGKDDKIAEIALRYGLSHVERYSAAWRSMIDDVECLKCFGSKSDDLHTRAVQWFVKHMTLTKEAKALYEVCFYYVLGMELERHNAYYVGLERDHSIVQDAALRLAQHEHGNYSNHRFIFARRTKDAQTHDGDGLSKISFRQFWR